MKISTERAKELKALHWFRMMERVIGKRPYYLNNNK